MPRGAFLAARLEQEPGAALSLIDEKLEQSGGAGILMIVGELVGVRIAWPMCFLSSISSRSISRGGNNILRA